MQHFRHVELGSRSVEVPEAVLFLGAVFGAGVIAIASAPDGSTIAIWWPAAGIAVALLALTPRAWWWCLVPGSWR